MERYVHGVGKKNGALLNHIHSNGYLRIEAIIAVRGQNQTEKTTCYVHLLCLIYPFVIMYVIMCSKVLRDRHQDML